MSSHRLSPLSAPVSGVLRFLSLLCLALPLLAVPARAVSVPSVASIARTQPGPVTTAAALEWRVTFSQNVTGVDAGDFTLTPVDGAATATLGTVTAGANAAEYLVTATGVTGIGTLRLDVKSSGTGIVDGASNVLSGGFTLGQAYTHALGTVPVAWGKNYDGQLGLGTTDYDAHPEPALVLHTGALSGKTVVAVSAGSSYSLALCSDGTVAAWGSNGAGQLGNGATEASSTPVAVNMTGVLNGKTVVSVATGGFHSLALCSDGTVAAWGSNGSGQLGDGTTTSSSTPVAVKTDTGALSGKTVVAVSAGFSHSLALCSDGTVVAWGYNLYGELGNGSTDASSTPVLVDMTGVLAGKRVVSLSAGVCDSLALCSDGTVAAWGRNSSGQLGNGSTEDSSTPVLVEMTGVLNGKTVVAVSAGSYHSLALCNDGTVAAWGGGYSGELGNHSTTNSSTPVTVEMAGVLNGKTVVSVSAGEYYSLALCSDGTVAAWGHNYYGELGNSLVVGDALTPVAVRTAAGVLAGRPVYALGSGCSSSLVLASVAKSITAVEPPAAGTYKAGATLTFTLTTEAAVTVTGTPRLALTIGTETRYATYASGSGTNSLVFTYTVAAGETDADGIAVASAIDLNGGTLIASGNWPVALALPAYTLPTIQVDAVPPAVVTVARMQPGPVTTAGTLKWRVTFTEAVTGVDLADFELTTVAGTATAALGTVTAGANAAEYLVEATGVTGIGTLRLDVKASGTGIADAMGNVFFVGFTQGQPYTHALGTVPVTWGYNYYGQLGLGTTNDGAHSVPALVLHTGALADKTVVSVSAGEYHSLALCSDGTVAAWGRNGSGQLGNHSTTDSSTPVPVDMAGVLSGKTVVSVSAGQNFSLALCSDGTVAAWGYNYYGQLGDGSKANSDTPVLVDMAGVLNGKTVVAVSAGRTHSLALCSDSTVTAWGDNDFGQLGNGLMWSNSSIPVLVDMTGVLSGKTVVAVSAGWSYSLALCSDGTVAAWGFNGSGQLGDGTTTDSSMPVLVDMTGVLSGKTVVAVSTGSHHSLALCSDGTVAAWGLNGSGQLGNGSTAASSTPVSVDISASSALSGKTVVSVSTGEANSLALCSDGTVAAWGANSYGQLGNGSLGLSFTPVAVKTDTGALAGRPVYGLGFGSGAGHSVVLASVAKSITAVEPPTAGTYKAGATLTFTLTTEAAVTVTGTPRLALTIGTETRYATYASGSGTNSLVFICTVAAGETDADGIAVASAIDLNGGTLIASGNWPVALALPAYTLPAIKVDGPPTVATVARMQPGPVTTAGTLKWRVTFTEAVTGVDLADFELTTVAGTATAALGTVTAGANAAEYLVEATGVTGIGTLRLDVKASGTGIVDDENRALAGGFTLGQSYTHARGMVPVAWGDNEYGQLGLGTTNDGVHSLPALVLHTGVLADKTVVSVSAGEYHSLALCSDGTVAAWGGNQHGQLGNGSAEDSPIPVLVDMTGVLSGKTVVSVSAGTHHSLALCSDGTVAAWGSNGAGELGNGSMTDSTMPVLVDMTGVLSGKTVVSVSAGLSYSLALCSDGTVSAWGGNSYGQLGNDSTEYSSTPVSVRTEGPSALTGKIVVSVSAGFSHSLALCSDGTVAAWGSNFSGQLGNGTTTDWRTPTSTPVLVGMPGASAGGKTVVSVSAGSYHSLALCSDGTVVAWGANDYGQLGSYSTPYSSSTLLFVDMTGALSGKIVVSVSAGDVHSLALCSDGTVAAWGANSYGQLGNGSLGLSFTPVAVKTDAGALAGRSVYALDCGGGGGLVLASAAKAITAVEPPAAGTYKAGTTLTFKLTTEAPVTVTGTPRLALTVGTVRRYATYVVESSTGTRLVFTYTVAAGDADADGIAVASAIDLNGGTLIGAGDWPVALALPAYTLPTIAVDTVAPVLTAATLVSSNATDILAKAGDTVTLSFKANDALQAPTVTLVGKPATVSYDSGTNTWTATHTVAVGDVEGAVTFSIAFSDVAGNAGTTVTATADESAVMIDLAAPETTLTSQPATISKSASAMFTFSATDAARYEASLDGGAYAAATSPATYIGLTDGSHTFAVRAFDAAGNVDATPASYSWMVDLTAPTTPTIGSITSTGVSGTAEAGSNVEVFSGARSLGTAIADGTGHWSLSVSLADGDYSLTATSKDAAGNATSMVVPITRTIDTIVPTLPSVTLVSSNATPSLATAGDTVTLSFRASETLQTPTVTLAGATATATYESGTSTWTAMHTVAAADAERAVTFSIAFSDVAGNAGTTVTATTDESAVMIDLTAPETIITSQPATISKSASATFAFSATDAARYEASLDGGAYAAATSPATLTGLADGSHTFAVRAVDAAGNVDATPANYTWTVDTVVTPPVVTPPETPTVPTTTPTLTGTAEAGSTVKVYEGAALLGTTTADATGAWSFTPPTPLGHGVHTLTVTSTDAAGNVSQISSLQLTIETPSQFSALSARAPAGTGEQTLILGFVFAGGGKPTLVRGVGPGISTVSGYMRDPQLRLYTASGVEVASNDDWAGSSELTDAFVRTGAGALDPASKDAALFENLTGNVYTAHVSGAAGTTGVALAEAYDVSLGDKTKRLTALSVRNQVGVDDAILIAGFVISGDVPKRVVVRGVGPGISTVSGYLRDPQLQVWKLNTLVAPAKWELVGENDDWDHTATTAALFKSVGMGELASDSKDAALVLTLEPGIYTAQVSGVGRSTGVGLAEIYEAP